MLLEYFEEHNEFYAMKVGKDTSQITVNHYKLTKLRLQEFLKAEYNLSDIPLRDLTLVVLENFYLYLRKECNCENNFSMKTYAAASRDCIFRQEYG
ncbi:MAG: phage integrase SAM-like domain-containing protein [Dysgonomonas sp.]